jgi:hypothetical protein
MLTGASVLPDYDTVGFSAAYSEMSSAASAYLWAGLTTADKAVKVKSTSAKAAADKTELYFAAMADMMVRPATYTGTVLLTIVPNIMPTAVWVKADATATDKSTLGYEIDMDSNMIPVVNKLSDGNYPANWCNYGKRQWCNAVTVDPAYLATAQGAAVGAAIPEDKILGYWVYIPRYAYEVQRRDAVDRPVCPGNSFTGAGNTLMCSNMTNSQSLFDIRFEKKTAGLKTPIATTSTATVHNDYRGAMGSYRAYPGHDVTSTTSTWATHPAFWWDKNSDGVRTSDEELNGIWVGKFETTGSISQPTVKPNLKSQIGQMIGVQFSTAKSMGPNYGDGGGNATYTVAGGGTANYAYSENYHNFGSSGSNLNVHQQKNTEWGAVAYLSISIYGMGANNTKVQNNSYNLTMVDDNGTTGGYGVTGCGPASRGSDVAQTTGCSSYNTILGQLASTTRNIYGVYDMAGGAWDRMMGVRTATKGVVDGSMLEAPALKYVNLYGINGLVLPNVLGTGEAVHNFSTAPGWSVSAEEQYFGWDRCTWEICGGQSLIETAVIQSMSGASRSWNGDFSDFVDATYPWLERGGATYNAANAGLFSAYSVGGIGYTGVGFRVALVKF